MRYVTNQNSTKTSQEKKYSKIKLRNLKTSKNNERNTQKECQGRQTKRLQNQENDQNMIINVMRGMCPNFGRP